MKKFLPLSLSLLLIAACQTNPEQYPEHKCNETEDNFIITEVNEPLTQEQIELIENAVSQSSTKTLYHVDLQNLQSFLGESQVQVLVFSATWCGPCKLYRPIVEDLSERYIETDCKFGIVDVDREMALCSSLNITVVPTTLIIQYFTIVERIVGLVDKNTLKSHIDPYIQLL